MYLLLVDYSLISFEELQEMIRQSSGDDDVINCFSTSTLLKVAEKISPEGIIIDFDLIEEDLPAFCKSLRKKSGDAFILAFTSSDYYQKLSHAIEHGGIDEYMVKPIRSEEFMTRIHIATKRKNAAARKIVSLPLGEKDSSKMKKKFFDENMVEEDDISRDPTDFDPIDDEYTDVIQAEEKGMAGFSDNLESVYDLFNAQDEEYQYLSEGPDLFERDYSDRRSEPESEPQIYEEDYDEHNHFASRSALDNLMTDDDPGEQFHSEQIREQIEPSEEAKPVSDLDDDFDFDQLLNENVGQRQPDQDIFNGPDEPGYGLFEETGDLESKEELNMIFDDVIGDKVFDYDAGESGPETEEDKLKTFEEILNGAGEEDSYKYDLDFENFKPHYDDSFSEQYSSSEEPSTAAGDPESPGSSREIKIESSLPGNSADEFLYGEDFLQPEGYNEDLLNDFIQEGYEEEKLLSRRKNKSKPAGKTRAASIIINTVFIFLLLTMAVVSFFLIQHRVTGEAPQVAGYRLQIIDNEGISPDIEAGSLAFVRKVDLEEIGVNDLITFRSPDDLNLLVTRRVVEVTGDDNLQFITSGGDHQLNDFGPVPAQNVVGRVTGSVPYLGYFLDYAQTSQGLILFIFIPGVIIIGYEVSQIIIHLSRKKNGRKNKKNKKANQPAENQG